LRAQGAPQFAQEAADDALKLLIQQHEALRKAEQAAEEAYRMAERDLKAEQADAAARKQAKKDRDDAERELNFELKQEAKEKKTRQDLAKGQDEDAAREIREIEREGAELTRQWLKEKIEADKETEKQHKDDIKDLDEQAKKNNEFRRASQEALQQFNHQEDEQLKKDDRGSGVRIFHGVEDFANSIQEGLTKEDTLPTLKEMHTTLLAIKDKIGPGGMVA
jgi:hypothetical protein